MLFWIFLSLENTRITLIHYVNVIITFLVHVTLTKKERAFSTRLLHKKSEFAVLISHWLFLADVTKQPLGHKHNPNKRCNFRTRGCMCDYTNWHQKQAAHWRTVLAEYLPLCSALVEHIILILREFTHFWVSEFTSPLPILHS